MGETLSGLVSPVTEKRRGCSTNLSSSSSKVIFPKEQSDRRGRIVMRVKGNDVVGMATVFLVKVVALEAVRRASMSVRCPVVWRGIQALQFLCYPPLKWFQRWAPLRRLINGVQMFSRPLLFLSVANAFSNESDEHASHFEREDCSSFNAESPVESPSECTLTEGSTDVEKHHSSANWLIQLYEELDKQGITLPERISEDDLKRFYEAANEDFSSFLSMIKKTIRWRNTYRIMTAKELEKWSGVVFWHGCDLESRPCLIVRLGLACTYLCTNERPSFIQAVVSQVERGVLNLKGESEPHITVLVDCDGITPLRVPMQMVRSCVSILVENYPSHLGNLYVVRLPPVVRVIAQTLFQVLNPPTRKKMTITGRRYKRVLAEALATVPAFLGGKCVCKVCFGEGENGEVKGMARKMEGSAMSIDAERLDPTQLICEDDLNLIDDWDRLMRTAVVGSLMLWIFIAFLAGFFEP